MRWSCVALLSVSFCFVVCSGCSGGKKDKDKGGGGSSNPPIAAFTADPKSGPAPLTVRFTDNSSGNITSRQWKFGDGSGSSEQNPTHTYNDPGTYTVTLTVSGPDGTDSAQETIEVTSGGGGSTPSYMVVFDNVNVAVADDASQSRLEELGKHFKTWAEYLWVLTGGQMCVRKITIYDNTKPQRVGEFLIYIPEGLLESSSLGWNAAGCYLPTYDLIEVPGRFPIFVLLHEWAHARMQHTVYEEYAYNGSCQCIMVPPYYMLWCDKSNHTNSCPIACWESFLERYPDWVPPHDENGNVPSAWQDRSSQPMPSVTYEIHNN